MSELSELDKNFIQNMMLTHSHKEIAGMLSVDIADIKNFIYTVTNGSLIITRQAVIDRSKKAAKKKIKKISDKKIQEEWRKEKKQKIKNYNEHIQFESRKKHAQKNPSFKSKEVNYQALISVKVDERTYILISPGEDRDAAIKKFYQNRLTLKKNEDIY
jgi:hypothetical protein